MMALILLAMAVADVIRAQGRQDVEVVGNMGIEVAILIGDSQAVVKAVAHQLGIKRVFAEVLPKVGR